MNDIFRKLNFMQKMRIEVMDDAVDEIIRIRAHNEKMIAASRDLERMLSNIRLPAAFHWHILSPPVPHGGWINRRAKDCDIDWCHFKSEEAKP